MVKEIIETKYFAKIIEGFFKKGQLLREDYDAFKKNLAENPELGDVIPGAGGIRKIRLKSASKGKSGGFRVCYYQVVHRYRIFLLAIYPKNTQEDISMAEKKVLKELVTYLKEVNK